MTTATNGAAPPDLETALRGATDRANESLAVTATPEAPANEDATLDPNVAGENAAHAVHKCLVVADHIREMGNEFVALAQTIKATGDTLAMDIENRAHHFDKLMQSARTYAQETLGVFAAERAKLSGMKLPGSGA